MAVISLKTIVLGLFRIFERGRTGSQLLPHVYIYTLVSVQCSALVGSSIQATDREKFDEVDGINFADRLILLKPAA